MNIGLDVDGVIFNTEEWLSLYAEIFDIETYKKDTLIKPYEYYKELQYDWEKEKSDEFLKTYLLKSTYDSTFIAGAIWVIKRLKELGHKIIIISARGNDYPEALPVLEKRFEDAGLTFDKIHWKINNKLDVCLTENIDIMVDDRPSTCKKLSDNNIHTLYLKNESRVELENNDYLKTVRNWGEIYKQIILYSQKQK